MQFRAGNLGLWALAGFATFAAVLPTPADAQQMKKPAADQGPAKKDPNAALKAYETGAKAYDGGKLEPAVQALSTALTSGGLPPDKMAKAYYYRGLAYKKQKKPAQALSDLTTSVWVNGGLNDSDKAAAMQARNDVYREAGLGDQAPPIANAVVPPPKPAGGVAQTAAPAAPAAAAPAPPPAPPPAPIAAMPTAMPEAQPAPAAPSRPPAASAEQPVWQADTVTTSRAAPSASAMPTSVPQPQQTAAVSDAYVPPGQPMAAPSNLATAPDPAQPAASSDTLSPIAKAGESIGGFFSNMFGQSSSPPAPAPVATTTGSTGSDLTQGWEAADSARPQGPAAQVSASEPQRAPGFETRVAVNEPASAPLPSAGKSGGKYRLQLASVRSRDEADRLVQTLMSAHGAQLGGAEASVDETVIGNMGTFYRVRLGPYADANEPRKLCTTLKPQGYDCQVVTK